VPLATEIAALRNYLAVEQIRFEDRLQVTLEIAPDAEAAAMPPFLLHPLVENAITHGFSSSGTPLMLRVTACVRDEMLWVEVINSGHWRARRGNSDGRTSPHPNPLPAARGAREPASADRRGTGTGLRNVQSRLEAVAPRAHHFSIDEANARVTVRLSLPYRPLPIPADVRLQSADPAWHGRSTSASVN
jgi:LytS/YehU family sensor histidine kinase